MYNGQCFLFQLPGGPRHRKADSMPETVLEGAEESPFYGPKDVSVSRSHSDSRKRADTVEGSTSLDEVPTGTASLDEIEKLRVGPLALSSSQTKTVSQSADVIFDPHERC